MCFSAEASFGASAVLGTVGYFAIKNTNTGSQRLFASIPLIFAFQQLTEGFLWVAFENNLPTLQAVCTYMFLVIAQVIWPTLVPYSILLLESDEQRKKWLHLMLFLGSVASVYLAYCMGIYNVRAEVDCYHIHYDLHFPGANPFTILLFYVLPTVATLFISSVKKMNVLGILVVITLVIAHLFYKKYALSVWCFFAAIMSLQVLSIIKTRNNYREKNTLAP